jgi:hypothetical protein
MATEKPPTKPASPRAPAAARSSLSKNNRLALRFLALPAVAVGAVLLFNGTRDRFSLPECDSDRAKQTLSEVLKQLKYEPVRFEPIKTVSASKSEVICSAVLPLPDGANVVLDYSFYWQGGKANMKYTIARKAS